MFRSQRQNRRKRSAKERRAERRQTLRTMVRRVAVVLGLAVVAAGLPALIFYGYSHLMESEYFSLAYVDVEGLHYLEEEALLAATEEVAGDHILDVRPERLESTMRTLPFVADVKVERRFPDRLHILITEFTPEAIIVDDGFWLVDAQGEVFLSLDGSSPDGELWELPLVTGLTRAELDTGSGHGLFEMALDANHHYVKMGLGENFAVSEIHVDELLGISLVVGDSGTEVRLGRGRWEQRFERLEVVQHSLEQRGVDAAYVLIDHESDLSRVAVGQRREPGNGEVEESQH